MASAGVLGESRPDGILANTAASAVWITALLPWQKKRDCHARCGTPSLLGPLAPIGSAREKKQELDSVSTQFVSYTAIPKLHLWSQHVQRGRSDDPEQLDRQR